MRTGQQVDGVLSVVFVVLVDAHVVLKGGGLLIEIRGRERLVDYYELQRWRRMSADG